MSDLREVHDQLVALLGPGAKTMPVLRFLSVEDMSAERVTDVISCEGEYSPVAPATDLFVARLYRSSYLHQLEDQIEAIELTFFFTEHRTRSIEMWIYAHYAALWQDQAGQISGALLFGAMTEINDADSESVQVVMHFTRARVLS